MVFHILSPVVGNRRFYPNFGSRR